MSARRFKQAACIAVMVLGLLGLVGVWTEPVSTLEAGLLSEIAAALGLFILGGAGLQCIQAGYRGGVASLVGAVLVYFGVVNVFMSVEELLYSELGARELLAGLLATVILLGGGAALLWSGHGKQAGRASGESGSP